LTISTFVTVPVKVMGLVASNSAAKEWCADTRAAGVVSKATLTATTFILLPVMRPSNFRIVVSYYNGQHPHTTVRPSHAQTKGAVFSDLPTARIKDKDKDWPRGVRDAQTFAMTPAD
jgi:hypothetical protein